MITATCLLPTKTIRRDFQTQADAETWLCWMSKTCTPLVGYAGGFIIWTSRPMPGMDAGQTAGVMMKRAKEIFGIEKEDKHEDPDYWRTPGR